MKIVRGTNIKAIPASHEDKLDPGCLKKVLMKRDDLANGRIQMINWSTLLPNKSFSPHYHEDMQEIFIILDGSCEIETRMQNSSSQKLCNWADQPLVEKIKHEILNKGDVVIIDEMEIHKMTNKSDKEVNYIAIGVARETGGKTVRV